MKKDSRRKWNPKEGNYYIFMAITFILVMVILVLCNLFTKDKNFSEQENRVLESIPRISYDNVFNGVFKSDFETYVNDQFPLRNLWIKLKITADVAEGKVESNGVYRGKDGYLLENFHTPSKKSQKETAQSIKAFSKKHKDLKTYVLIAPTAVNVLKDKLPAHGSMGNQNVYMDYLYGSLKKTSIHTIDVRESFQKQAENEQLYYHSDHHWTSTGAYRAFLETAKSMKIKVNQRYYAPSTVKKDFEGMLASKSGFYMADKDSIDVYFPNKKTPRSVITYVDEQEKSPSFYDSKNLNKRDAYTVFLNGNHPLIKIKTATPRKGRLLIIKDSYANCFIPFIAPYFREVVVVDPRYYFNNLNKLINSQDITHVLFLYNANTLSEDRSLNTMLSE